MKINPAIRFISNIIAGIMPTKKLRHRVRNAIRHSKRCYNQIKRQWAEHGDKIIPGRFKEYNLVFVVGAACATTIVLRNFKLRTFSNPLEWTAGDETIEFSTRPGMLRNSRFNEKIDALCDEFRDFFNYDDLANVGSFFLPRRDGFHAILNTRTNIRFPHLFPTTHSWQRYYPTAHDIISRRAQRLIDAMNKSQRILIIWANRIADQNNIHDAPIPDADIIRAVDKVSAKWPNRDIDFVFFEHDGTMDKFKFIKTAVCPGAYRIQSNHYDAAPEYNAKYPAEEHNTPPLVMAEMLDNIKLSKK